MMRFESQIMLGILGVLLLAAAWIDLTTRKIPNVLILIGLFLGLISNGLLTQGAGFQSKLIPGGVGWLDSLSGLLLGFSFFIPSYWLRLMGAGDVKLMTMVGAFLGTVGVIGATLFSFMAGGLIAFFVALREHSMLRLFENLRFMIFGSMVRASSLQLPSIQDFPQPVAKMPYGVAIAIGTLSYLLWKQVR